MQGCKFHTLDTIILADFIELYLGDDSKAVAEGEATEAEIRNAARKISAEYSRIIGGRMVASKLYKMDTLNNLERRGAVLTSAMNMALKGYIKDAQTIMSSLGYEIKDEMLIRKIEALLATDKMKIDRLLAQPSGECTPTRERMTRERVALMRHTGMYIDTGKMRASEYAWMLKAMCDELDAAVRNSKKNKR